MIQRILRGGSCYDDSWSLRTTSRLRLVPEYRDWGFGFRIVIKRKK